MSTWFRVLAIILNVYNPMILYEFANVVIDIFFSGSDSIQFLMP